MLDTWVRAVRSVTPSLQAICRLVLPSAMRVSTSRSRAVRVSAAGRGARSDAASSLAAAGSRWHWPAAAARIAAATSPAWASLSRYPAAPASSAARTLASSCIGYAFTFAVIAAFWLDHRRAFHIGRHDQGLA